jgi:HSP20 family molecular chaperone IbpA
MSHLHGLQEHHHLPVGHFPRHLFDFENFLGPSLDLFDPFDEIDLASHRMQTALQWLQDPPRLQRELCPVTGHKKRSHSDKFRVTLDVTGYKPEDLSVKVVGRKLYIDGKQEFRDGEDYSVKEMRKVYDIPENASFEHMTSFLTTKGTLVVEFPLVTQTKERDDHHHQLQKYGDNVKEFNFDEFFKSAFEPKICDDTEKGGKKIDLSLDMTGFRPDQIQIHLKDHDLIVQGESSSSDKHHTARSYIYKAVTLPPNIDVEHMRSFLHDGKRLIITAPYHENSTALSNGKNGALQHGDHNLSSLKNGNNTDDLKILGGASPTSSTRSIAGSVDSTFSNKR